jgi:hypothetical protein
LCERTYSTTGSGVRYRMDAPSPARVLMAVEDIAIGVMKKVMILPAGADSSSRGLSVMRGHASLGKAPGPYDCHAWSSARIATTKCASSKSSIQRCQVSIFSKASEPVRNTIGCSGPRSLRISASVS